MHKLSIYIECEPRCLRESEKMFGYVRVEPDGTKRRAVNGAVTTWHRAVLASLRGAMAKINDSYELHIYSDNGYVLNNIVNGNLEHWAENDYKNRAGYPIKNHDMWKEVYRLTRGQKVIVHVGGHCYSDALRDRFVEVETEKTGNKR